MTDIHGMKEAGAKAISEDGKSVMNAQVYREAMKEAAKEGLLVMAHCEDKNMVGKGAMNAGKKAEELGMCGITNGVEDVIVARDILLAKETGARLHLCHCSTVDSVHMIREARKIELPVSGEVCPHHFSLTQDDIPGDDANYKMNPPLRSKEDVEALCVGLADGVMEAISTDHAPHGEEEKKQSIATAPFGIVGSETAYCLAVTNLVKKGYLTPMQLVERMSTGPTGSWECREAVWQRECLQILPSQIWIPVIRLIKVNLYPKEETHHLMAVKSLDEFFIPLLMAR